MMTYDDSVWISSTQRNLIETEHSEGAFWMCRSFAAVQSTANYKNRSRLTIAESTLLPAHESSTGNPQIFF